MITHIVMFKLDASVPDAAQMIHDKLMALPDVIPQIRHFEVGMNIVESERNYDLVLVSKFDSLDDMAIYQANADHQTALAYIKTVAQSVVVVDYEMD